MQIQRLYRLAIAMLLAMAPNILWASVEGSLESVRQTMVGKVGTLIAILGFIFAGFSYITGNPNARTHLVLAVIGAFVLFGASSIVSFIQTMVH